MQERNILLHKNWEIMGAFRQLGSHVYEKIDLVTLFPKLVLHYYSGVIDVQHC